MLKNKLKRNMAETNDETPATSELEQNQVNFQNVAAYFASHYFAPLLWQQFFALEAQLNSKLALLQDAPVQYIYNPVEYAAQLHCQYLQRFLGNKEKRLVIVGMNPGPNGMVQTGVN